MGGRERGKRLQGGEKVKYSKTIKRPMTKQTTDFISMFNSKFSMPWNSAIISKEIYNKMFGYLGVKVKRIGLFKLYIGHGHY